MASSAPNLTKDRYNADDIDRILKYSQETGNPVTFAPARGQGQFYMEFERETGGPFIPPFTLTADAKAHLAEAAKTNPASVHFTPDNGISSLRQELNSQQGDDRNQLTGQEMQRTLELAATNNQRITGHDYGDGTVEFQIGESSRTFRVTPEALQALRTSPQADLKPATTEMKVEHAKDLLSNSEYYESGPKTAAFVRYVMNNQDVRASMSFEMGATSSPGDQKIDLTVTVGSNDRTLHLDQNTFEQLQKSGVKIEAYKEPVFKPGLGAPEVEVEAPEPKAGSPEPAAAAKPAPSAAAPAPSTPAPAAPTARTDQFVDDGRVSHREATITQAALQRMGLYDGPLDGDLGSPEVKNALNNLRQQFPNLANETVGSPQFFTGLIDAVQRAGNDGVGEQYLLPRDAVIKAQQIIGTEPDGLWGPKTQAKYEAYCKEHHLDTSKGLSAEIREALHLNTQQRSEALIEPEAPLVAAPIASMDPQIALTQNEPASVEQITAAPKAQWLEPQISLARNEPQSLEIMPAQQAQWVEPAISLVRNEPVSVETVVGVQQAAWEAAPAKPTASATPPTPTGRNAEIAETAKDSAVVMNNLGNKDVQNAMADLDGKAGFSIGDVYAFQKLGSKDLDTIRGIADVLKQSGTGEVRNTDLLTAHSAPPPPTPGQQAAAQATGR